MERKSVLHSTISVGGYHEFIDEIFSLVKFKVPAYVCFANVHMVMEGYKDKLFQRIMNNATLVAPDGKPISLFIKYFSKIRQVRICGMDVFPDLLRQAESAGRSVYFLGNTNEVLEIITIKAKKEFPELIICGSYSPPFRELSAEEDDAIVNNIKALSPDLVFVSLGCPRQEKWMATNKDKLGTCLLGVGQAFNTYAGVEKRLPLWMRNLSLEWMYRLSIEPKRLWKRYLITNSHFLLLTLLYMVARWKQDLYTSFVYSKIKNTILQKPDER
jgi:N-acetylglucosaminyldiphosphoundecaprenol N-acetyl-beta-D-mannosaminyltransferase